MLSWNPLFWLSFNSLYSFMEERTRFLRETLPGCSEERFPLPQRTSASVGVIGECVDDDILWSGNAGILCSRLFTPEFKFLVNLCEGFSCLFTPWLKFLVNLYEWFSRLRTRNHFGKTAKMKKRRCAKSNYAVVGKRRLKWGDLASPSLARVLRKWKHVQSWEEFRCFGMK